MLELPRGPRYFPLASGKYTVAPNLHPLGRDFGQGLYDRRALAVNDTYFKFRDNKINCFLNRKDQHVLRHGLVSSAETAIVRRLIDLIDEDLGELFEVHRAPDGIVIASKFSRDRWKFGTDRQLVQASIYNSADALVEELCYIPALDALCFVFQEDLAVVLRIQSDDVPSSDSLSYLNVCGPSHWAPESKIGRSFFDVHVPVPGSENLRKFSKAMVDTMVDKGPMVRFVWSFVTDTEINHHPDFGLTRAFDSTLAEPFYLRVEKQVIHSLPADNLGLFFIGISFTSASEILADAAKKALLRSTLESMSEDSKRYKGIAGCYGELIALLS